MSVSMNQFSTFLIEICPPYPEVEFSEDGDILAKWSLSKDGEDAGERMIVVFTGSESIVYFGAGLNDESIILKNSSSQENVSEVINKYLSENGKVLV